MVNRFAIQGLRASSRQGRLLGAAMLFAVLVEGIEYGIKPLSFGRVWIDLL